MTLDLAYLQQWVGSTEQQDDALNLATLQAMAATLNHNPAAINEGYVLPPLWHWIFFHSPARQSSLGTDGHPQHGGFLPPVPLPRRMWAGSRFSFHQALRCGLTATRRSRILTLDAKKGRSGDLVFVSVEHEIYSDAGLMLREEQDIVYRSAASGEAGQETLAAGILAPQDALFHRSVTPDPVLLFRYSALTFNGHRIHYDRDYVTQQEGYPGLVVHGPLLATLLMNLLLESVPGLQVSAFSFKAQRPVFDTAPFQICARASGESTYTLWVQDADGFLCMQANAETMTAA
jgi:3-methylfumaryl-CoA hydratase